MTTVLVEQYAALIACLSSYPANVAEVAAWDSA